MDNSIYNVNENAANNVASVNVLDIYRTGNKKKCAKYFGTWFPGDLEKAVEAIEDRLDKMPIWQQNLESLYSCLKVKASLKSEYDDRFYKMSDNEVGDFLHAGNK